MRQSDQIAELAAALSKAQSEMTGIKRNSVNSFFQSSYSDLETVLSSVRAALSKQGIAISQVLDFDPNFGTILETVLLHTSGQFLSSRVPLNAKANDAQTVGASITYYRRFSAMAICGIAAESEDDDGESLAGRGQKPFVVSNQSRPLAAAVKQAVAEYKADTQPVNEVCCEQPMKVSKFNPAEIYCFKCKSKKARQS
jgi:hypothetical protein